IKSIRLHRHWLGSRKENRAMGRQFVRLSFVFTTHIGRRSRIIATLPYNRLGFGGFHVTRHETPPPSWWADARRGTSRSPQQAARDAGSSGARRDRPRSVR